MEIVPKSTLLKKPNQRTMKILSENWEKVRELALVGKRENIPYKGYDIEDVLIETFECIVREVKGKTEEQTIEEFLYRYRLHRRRAILNYRDEQKAIGTWRPEKDEIDEDLT